MLRSLKESALTWMELSWEEIFILIPVLYRATVKYGTRKMDSY